MRRFWPVHTEPFTPEDMIELFVLGAIYYCHRKDYSCPTFLSGSPNALLVGRKLDMLVGRAEWHGWQIRYDDGWENKYDA